MINKEFVINIENLSKSFGNFKALDNLSLNIRKGEIYGLIGPNGSGKTTTINILFGFLKADDGSKIEMLGHSVPSELSNILRSIGYVPQDLSLYMDLSIIQNLQFFGKLYNISTAFLKSSIQEILKLVDLLQFKNRVLNKCSGGMQRRTSLAVALLHKPKLLILDEPTVGIDPELRYTFWDYFKTLSTEQGTTILITTHYLAESVHCDRIGFINKKIIVSGEPHELQKQIQEKNNTKELPSMEDVFIHWNKQISISENIGGIK